MAQGRKCDHGSNGATLTLNDVEMSAAGNYSVVVSNAYGVAVSQEPR
jgi:hypothetical protein